MTMYYQCKIYYTINQLIRHQSYDNFKDNYFKN